MIQDSLRLALVQDNPIVGNLAGNADKAISHLQNNTDADIVVFSECFLTGYPLGDLVLRPAFLTQTEAFIQKIRDYVMQNDGPAVIIGAPVAATGLPYNSAFFIEPSGAMRIVNKTELPNSDVFNERRTFASSESQTPTTLSYRGFRIGLQICEDMWHGRVSRALADDLADILVVINGSPYQRGKQAERLRQAKARVKSTGLPLIYVNQFGGQDELVFDGGSFTMNTDGALMCAKAFESDVLHVVLQRQEDGETRILAANPDEFAKYPVDQMENDYKACVLGLRDYIAKTGSNNVYVGVSGGLDSALVLAMAVDAIGADNVTGIMMPSQFTGNESLSLADDLMARLSVQTKYIPIGDAVNVAHAALTATIGDDKDAKIGLMNENLQARIRGMMLMAMTNASGGIVLSTGNKSEMAVGYATLYGDMNGGFNPMKSVYKSEAFEMAAWRNSVDPQLIGDFAVANPIPQGIITRPPTAELAEGQEDSNSLGDYLALDCVLKSIIEQRNCASETAKVLKASFTPEELSTMICGLDPQSYCEKIAKLVRNAQYKRIQSPPGVKLHPTDFGFGWQYPVAGSYAL